MLIFQQGEATETVRGRTIVGRSPSSGWVVGLRLASSAHAVLAWTGERWVVRDLASTNGTFINGQRMTAGRDRALEVGDLLAFGDPGARWTVVDVTPPTLRATSGGEVRTASDGLLALPDDDHPEVVLVESDPGRWRLDGGAEVSGGHEIEAGGRRWLLDLPDRTEATAGMTAGGWDPQVAEAFFAVSADEEHVEIVLRHGGDLIELPARAHNYLLLLLARARLGDRRDGVEAGEEGWLSVDALCRMLRVSRAQLDLQIHRARRQVPRLMASSGGAFIERRTGAVRIGVAVLREVPRDALPKPA